MHLLQRMCRYGVVLLSFGVVSVNAVDAQTYAVTDDVGDCARTCLKQKPCLLILYGQIPGAKQGENCGPQSPGIGPGGIKALASISDSLKLFQNGEISSNSSSSPECDTFIHVPTGSSRSFTTPASLDPLNHCRVLIITDENSTLTVSAQFTCGWDCSCSDQLSIHNVWKDDSSQSEVVTACLDATDDQSNVVLQSAEGSFVVLELKRDVLSSASYNVTIESFSTANGTSPCTQCDDLVQDLNSAPNSSQCYRKQNYTRPPCAHDVNATVASFTTSQTTEISDVTTASVNNDVTVVVKNNTGSNINGSDSINNDNNNSTAANNTTIINNNDNSTATNNTATTNNDNNSTVTNNTAPANNFNKNKSQTSSGGSSDASAGTIAGAVVGAVLGLLLVALAISLAAWKYRKNKVKPGAEPETPDVVNIVTSSPPAATTKAAPKMAPVEAPDGTKSIPMLVY